MKKTFSIISSIFFGIILLVTLILCIVRCVLTDVSLLGFIESSLGIADKFAGNKAEVPGLIKFALSDTAFIIFIILSAALFATIIFLKKKFSSWFKDAAIPILTDGIILLAASLTICILYKVKIPKIAQGMLHSIYSDAQKMIIITGTITAIAGGALLFAGLFKGQKSHKHKR